MVSDSAREIIRRRIRQAIDDGIPQQRSALIQHVAGGPLKEDAVIDVLGEMFPEMGKSYRTVEETEHAITPEFLSLPSNTDNAIRIIRCLEIFYTDGVAEPNYHGISYDVVVRGQRHREVARDPRHAMIFALTLFQTEDEQKSRHLSEMYCLGTGIISNGPYA